MSKPLHIDLTKACIICLQEDSNNTNSIYDYHDGTITIEEQIFRCFPSYEAVEQRPDKICGGCLDDLNAAYRFFNNCETSSMLLRSIQEEDIKAEILFEPVQTNEVQSNFIEDIKFQINSSLNKDTEQEIEQIDNNDDDLSDREQYGYIEENVDESIENVEEPKPICNTIEIKQEKTQIVKRFKSKINQTLNTNCHLVKSQKNLQTKNNKNTPKICEICGNNYKYQHALKAHMRRHLNDRPFNCEFCEKKFVSNVELRRHIRVHTGAKPYCCSYCDRRFSDYGSRIKHERTHTGERPFSCPTCYKSFAYAHVLSVHLRTHTGEKKFKCTECDRGFTKKAYMLSHMEQHKRSAIIAAKDEEICNVVYLNKETTTSNAAQENSEESLGECITAFIVEETEEECSEQLETLENECENNEQLLETNSGQYTSKKVRA